MSQAYFPNKQMCFKFCVFLLLILPHLVVGQQTMESAQKRKKRKRENRWTHHFGVAVGLGKHELAGSLSWYHLYATGQKKRFKIGYGVRLNGVGGRDVPFTTAPAKLARDEEKVDTLYAEKPLTFALNAGIYASYDITPRLLVGLNFDLVGVSFGRKTDGTLYSTDLLPDSSIQVNSKPTLLNAFLIENNNIGTLNSELYLAYKITPKFRVKVGVQRLFHEHKTDKKYVQDNDRYRNKAFLGFIGFVWTPFVKDVDCPWFKTKKPKKLKEGQF